MSNAPVMLSYENIAVRLGTDELNKNYLLEMRIVKKINDHARISLIELVSDEEKDKYIKLADANTRIEVDGVSASGTVKLFRGIVTEVALKYDPTIQSYYLKIDGASHSYELDIELKQRSFPDEKITYRDLTQTIMAPYKGDIKLEAGEGKQSGRFVVQYQETDWEFLKRLASRLYAGLVPDPVADKPQLWFGVAQEAERKVGNAEDANLFYNVRKRIKDYRSLAANSMEGASEMDFVYYDVLTNEFFNLGDEVTLQLRDKQLKLAVFEATATIKKSVLKFEAVLSAPSGLRQGLLLHPQIAGVSLEGTVLAIDQDYVQVHLEIDKQYEKSHKPYLKGEKGHFFPYTAFYTAEGNTGWYCMPELGDSVILYFPTNYEEDGVVTHSIRKNIKGGAKIDNPDIKYFRTKFGKELMFSEKEIVITGKDGEILIRLNEDKGVEILSMKEVKILAKKDMLIDSQQKLSISAGSEINIACKNSSIKMDGKTLIKGSQVKTN